MARTDDPTTDHGPGADMASLRRRKTVRLLVPVGVAGAVAVTIGLVPALASSGSGSHPDLPKTTAEQLLTKLATSDVRTVSGTVRVHTDLGLPGFLGAGGVPRGGPFGGHQDGQDSKDGKGDEGSTADPQSKLPELAAGDHTLRVAADGPDHQRVSIVEHAAEYSIVHNGHDVWAYDSASNQVYHSTAGRRAHGGHAVPKNFPATPQDFAKQALKALDPTTSVTVDGTTRVAGQDAYRLLLTPKGSGSTVGSIAIAVDARNGAPLKFTLTPSSGGKAAVDVGYTSVSFAKPDAKTFRFTPPKGAKVTEAKDGAAPAAKLPGNPFGGSGLAVTGKGWNSVAHLKMPTGMLGGTAKDHGDMPKGFDPGSLLKSFGDRVNGRFGGGTVIHSRLVNVLITDNGDVYAGAVTKDALVAAASK
jgi:outer membrane lipoprotein-sorting protein